MDFDRFFVVVVLPVVVAPLGVFFLTIGLRGVRRPFLIRAKWFFGPFLLPFLPCVIPLAMLTPKVLGGETDLWGVIGWLSVVLGACVLPVAMWYGLRGYWAFAVTEASFREALLAALDKLELPYEETATSVRLTRLEAHLEVSFHSGRDVGHLNIKEAEHRPLLAPVVKAMNEHFQSSAVQTKRFPSVVRAAFGALLTVGAAAMCAFGSGVL